MTLIFSPSYAVDVWCQWLPIIYTLFKTQLPYPYFDITLLRLSCVYNPQMSSSEVDLALLGFCARLRYDKQL